MYNLLGFGGGKGWFKVLTGQLVAVAVEGLQIRKISDRFRELCQIQVFSFLASFFRVEKGSKYSPVSLLSRTFSDLSDFNFPIDSGSSAKFGCSVFIYCVLGFGGTRMVQSTHSSARCFRTKTRSNPEGYRSIPEALAIPGVQTFNTVYCCGARKVSATHWSACFSGRSGN